MPTSREIVVSPRAAERIAAARAFLDATPAGAQVLVIASAREAADDTVRALAASRGALAGVHRLTLNRLVAVLAADRMAEAGVAAADGLTAQAIAARAVHRLSPTAALGHFEPVKDRPGFASALARTVAELRLNAVGVASLRRLGAAGDAIAAVLEQFERELDDARLADRAAMLELARAAVLENQTLGLAGIPALLLDVKVDGLLESKLIAALAAGTNRFLATLPAGDTRTQGFLETALGVRAREIAQDRADDATSLARMQARLFGNTPPEGDSDGSVTVTSAPGEMHECVEVARQICEAARAGTPFDRIAVLLHDAPRYSSYLKEALERAEVPAYFARGTRLPEPGGRAMLALLACAADDLSARRFAEYLSLAQVPQPDQIAGQAASPANDSELTLTPLRADLDLPAPQPEREPDTSAPVPVVEGTVPAPWRWERLLVDAAVIGSAERWERRLRGLENELRTRRGQIADDEARIAALERRILDLEHLKTVAMPIISALASLPRAGASWGDWLALLRALADLAIRDREPVLSALAELEPMSPVGPVALDEVRLVLAGRLGRLERPPARRRYGAVFIATPERARGMAFDVVMVPGLAERVFPRKLTEDAILPDTAREKLSPHLVRQDSRVTAERLALRLAAGAAEQRVAFSYPRVDLDQGRPRVPSFYALEIFQAAEGRLLGFDELALRAAGSHSAPLGWPVPESSDRAIDDAEFDLALLTKLVDADPETTIGAANYLLGANEHLARALRARARRWIHRWTSADGLVDPAPETFAALARHQLRARSYSPTALQHFAECPYRFFLQAIQRLEPRDEAEAIEVVDPLTRGALFADVQFEILSALRDRKALPVTRASLADAVQLLDEKIEAVAAKRHDELAPAIERVWRDAIDGIRADLHEWLRRAADDPGHWTPEAFELGFGLRDREQADPRSSPDAVAVDGPLTLRGSIDLVERDPARRVRVTDHKTGKVRAEREFVIGGGKILQPVLYALAAERMLGERVHAGRLYYCTAAGGYEERIVEIGEEARASVRELGRTIDNALRAGFLPAAPDEEQCRWCDYKRVCGPYEERRVKLKPKDKLAALKRLREMP